MNVAFRALLLRRPTILLCLSLLILCVSDAAARSPISLDVLRRDGYGSVQLANFGENRLYVPAEINGKKIPLLLDTGWGTDGITVAQGPSALGITPAKGVSVGLSVNGVKSAMVHGTAQSVLMGNVLIRDTPVYFGRFTEPGFVGHGFLKTNNAILDSANKCLYLRPPGKGRRVELEPALRGLGLAKAPFHDAPHGVFVLNVQVNGVPAQVALDTGAQISVLDVRFAKMASAKGWGRNGSQIDANGTATPADLADTKAFTIEGVPIRTPTVMISRFSGYDLTGGKLVGVLGLDVIGMNWGIVDVGQHKFYFAKAD